ncbi:MAG TPA: protein kinase, partial [Candidatus Sulfotelmatobacter sp.]|nr:protein kinase [Candidatus Sulfotelmatobacter sp.]
MIGQQLSHYRIVEQIGAGGMGIVYRAHDEQLDREVAIKVLPPGSLADDAARKRFHQEALSLARLNHPNIATIHEFGTQAGCDFLVTEFIAGITLDAKLAAGALPPDQVVRLGVQLAAGLAAAHQQGLVHRDLKPGNLRLTTDGRLKILDFGLAQLTPHASDLGMTATVDQLQDTSGTLPYMSPEQLSGTLADARTDIWSAGAVLYEMATGKRPFAQAQPALVINAILNQSPETPSRLNPAVPVALNAVILRALARDRAARYQSAADLGAALEATTAPASTRIPVTTRRSQFEIILALAALLLIVAAGAYLLFHHLPRQAVSSPVARRRSVAVLGFKNLSANPDKSWLSTAISEMLTTELGEGDQLRTIPGESIAQMKASLALPDADSFGQQTLTRIRQNLGTDDVVIGSYVSLGNGSLRLDMRLQDTVAGVTLASVSEKGSEAEIDDLVSRAGAELRSKLGVSALSQEQSAAVRASLPSNPEAARLYSEGLQRLRLFDALAARDLLEKAAQLDPDFAPTHSALAEAWSSLGYESKATEQAKRGVELSAHSSPEDKLLISGRAHELTSEMPQAIESYQSLLESFPDNLDYGLLLVRAQGNAGRGADAEKTLAALRPLAVSEADTARLDFAEAGIARALSDFKRTQEAASRAAASGRAIGANLLAAPALQLEAAAWEHMGDLHKATDLTNQARALYVAAGDKAGAARCLVSVGDVLYDQGDYAGAKKQFETALPEFRELGAQERVRLVLERIGNVFYSVGQLTEAENYYRQCLAFDRQINNPNALASDYGNLANAADSLGDIFGSLKMQKQALAAFTRVGDRRGAADTLNNTGNVLVEIGDLSEARKYYEQALNLSREISYKRSEPTFTAGIGDVLFYQGDLSGGRQHYERAITLSKEMGDDDYAEQASVALAALALAEQKYSEGETLAAEAAARFEKSGSAVSSAWANSILARNLLAEGKLP